MSSCLNAGCHASSFHSFQRARCAIDYFRTFVTKLLFVVAKRVKPACLMAVAYLSTRVAFCDVDDMAKLLRLLGYLRYSRHRGNALKIDDPMEVGGTRVYSMCSLYHTSKGEVCKDSINIYDK